MGILDFLMRPGGGTVNQVMRDAKSPQLPGPYMLGSPNMPTENLGQISAPDSASGGPSLDAMMFADQAPQLPQPQTPRLPMPASAVPSSGGGLPVQPTGGSGTPGMPGQATASQLPAAATPAATFAEPETLDTTATPERASLQAFRAKKREMMTNVAGVMLNKGSPAMRVQGLQLLFEVQKDQEQEIAEQQKLQEDTQARRRSLAMIEAAPADETDKLRAKTLLQLGAKPDEIGTALRFNDAGAKERGERRDQFTKWMTTQSDEAAKFGTMQTAASRAAALIDKGVLATGANPVTSGLAYGASWIRGTDAYNLDQTLTTLKTIVGYDKLAEMREASKTGGALGSVTENETRWLQATQGSLDQFQDPEVLKQNIADIIKGKALSVQIRALVPGIEQGDRDAIEKYMKLTQDRAAIGEQVRQRLSETAGQNEVAPGGDSSHEKKYGLM
jgi:hypothetical protein